MTASTKRTRLLHDSLLFASIPSSRSDRGSFSPAEASNVVVPVLLSHHGPPAPQSGLLTDVTQTDILTLGKDVNVPEEWNNQTKTWLSDYHLVKNEVASCSKHHKGEAMSDRRSLHHAEGATPLAADKSPVSRCLATGMTNANLRTSLLGVRDGGGSRSIYAFGISPVMRAAVRSLEICPMISAHASNALQKRRRRRGVQRWIRIMTPFSFTVQALVCARQLHVRVSSSGPVFNETSFSLEWKDSRGGSLHHWSTKAMKDAGLTLCLCWPSEDSCSDEENNLVGQDALMPIRRVEDEKGPFTTRLLDEPYARDGSSWTCHSASDLIRGAIASWNDPFAASPSSGLPQGVLNSVRLQLPMSTSTIRDPGRPGIVRISTSNQLSSSYRRLRRLLLRYHQQATFYLKMPMRIRIRASFGSVLRSSIVSTKSAITSISAAASTVTAVAATADVAVRMLPPMLSSSGFLNVHGEEILSSSEDSFTRISDGAISGLSKKHSGDYSSSDSCRSHKRFLREGLEQDYRHVQEGPNVDNDNQAGHDQPAPSGNQQVSMQDADQGQDRSLSQTRELQQQQQQPHQELPSSRQQPDGSSSTQQHQYAIFQNFMRSTEMSRAPPTLPSTPMPNEPLAHQIRRVQSTHIMNLRRQWEQQQERQRRLALTHRQGQQPQHIGSELLPGSVPMSRYRAAPLSSDHQPSTTSGQSEGASSFNFSEYPVPPAPLSVPLSLSSQTASRIVGAVPVSRLSSRGSTVTIRSGYTQQSPNFISSDSRIAGPGSQQASSPPRAVTLPPAIVSEIRAPEAAAARSITPPYSIPRSNMSPPNLFTSTSDSSAMSPYYAYPPPNPESSIPEQALTDPTTSPGQAATTPDLISQTHAVPDEQYRRTQYRGANSLYINYEGGTLRPGEQWRRGSEEMVGR